MDATFIIGSGNNRSIVDKALFEKCLLLEQAYKFKPIQILAVGKFCSEMFNNIVTFFRRFKEIFVVAVVDPMIERYGSLSLAAENLFPVPCYPEDDYFEKPVFEKPCNITCNYVPKVSKRKAWFTMVRRRV